MHHGIPFADVIPNFNIASGLDFPFIAAWKNDGNVVATPAIRKMAAFLKGHGIVYAGFDSAIEMQEGVKENATEELRMLGEAFKQIAHQSGAAIDLATHTPKTASSAHGDILAQRGAGALGANVRGGLTVMNKDLNRRLVHDDMRVPAYRVAR